MATEPRACRTCGRPIRWVGGLRRPVDAASSYFVVDETAPGTAFTDRGDVLRGRFVERVEPGKPWVVGYRPHVCGREEEKGTPCEA